MNRREAAMRHDDKNDPGRLREQLQEQERPEPTHVVFDFTGLDRPNAAVQWAAANDVDFKTRAA